MAQIRFAQTDSNGQLTGKPAEQVQKIATAVASNATAAAERAAQKTLTSVEIADGKVRLTTADESVLEAALPPTQTGPTIQDNGDGTATINF